jgi:hypothetical protein
MLFCFNCEKHGHIEIECPEGYETKTPIEIEDNYEVELISALDEIKKEREENKSIKKELMKQKESFQGSEEAQQVIKNLISSLEEARRIEETLEYQKQCLEANIAAKKEEA